MPILSDDVSRGKKSKVSKWLPAVALASLGLLILLPVVPLVHPVHVRVGTQSLHAVVLDRECLPYCRPGAHYEEIRSPQIVCRDWSLRLGDFAYVVEWVSRPGRRSGRSSKR